jgi:hypothetical protein
MAIATVTKGGDQPTRARLNRVDLSGLQLPTKKSVPSTNLSDYIIFLYGQRKIGKTSLVSNFPNALHLFFEPGGKGLSTYPMELTYWEEFLHVVDNLLPSADGDRYDNVVVDTVDLCYDMCVNWYCAKEYISHPGDNNDYGKTWDLLKTEFTEAIHKLTHLGKGVIFVSHAKETEIKTRNQGTWTKITPTLKDRAAGYIMGAADINAYYGYFGDERFLIMDGAEGVDCGTRLKHAFRTPDGDRIVAIPMGQTDEEAYENFMTAFRNEQIDSFAEIHKATVSLTDHTAVLKAKQGRS